MAKDKDFTKIDNNLIKFVHELGLSHLDFQIIATVQMHARENRLAHCSNEKVASIVGISERTVKSSSGKMQFLGYLKRAKGGKKPFWDFTPLYEILNKLSTGKHDSLLDGIKKRIEDYKTVKNPAPLKKKKLGNLVQLTVNNLAKKEAVTVKHTSPEVDKKEVNNKNTPEIGETVEETFSIFKDRENYFSNEEKNEERLKLIRETRKKIQGALN